MEDHGDSRLIDNPNKPRTPWKAVHMESNTRSGRCNRLDAIIEQKISLQIVCNKVDRICDVKNENAAEGLFWQRIMDDSRYSRKEFEFFQ